MTYLLAHDLGTSANKAVLYTTEGLLVKSATCSYPLHVPNINCAEQDAQHWWQAVCSATKQLVEGINPGSIAAVSFSGQMMGCLCVDRAGMPLRRSMIWADMRATEQEERLMRLIDPWEYYKISGHRASCAYSGFKLMWIRDNEPDVYQKTYKTLNAKDYIILKLTGRFVTEYSDASSTGFWNLKEQRWSSELITLAGLDEDKFPEAVESTQVAGKVSAAAAALTGLMEGTPVVCGGGDGACAAVGSGCVTEGAANICLGTSSWISVTTKKPMDDREMRNVTWPHIIPGYYIPCGAMQCGGGSYNWVVSEFCDKEEAVAEQNHMDKFAVVEGVVEKVPPGANGMLFLPYLLGERSPWWNPDAKGAFLGLTLRHTRQDMLRAVMEGVALNLERVLTAMPEKGQSIKELVMIGGAADSGVWRQIFADVLRRKVIKPSLTREATSIGAVVTGGVGVGAFKDFTAVDLFLKVEQEHTPIEANSLVYDQLKPLFEQCYRSLEPTFKQFTANQRNRPEQESPCL